MSAAKIIGIETISSTKSLLQRVFAKAKLTGTASFCDSFYEATLQARDASKGGREVVLVGSLADVHVPDSVKEAHLPGAFTESEWQAAWLAYLGKYKIGWAEVYPEAPPSRTASSNRQSVIRSYQRACEALGHFLARLRSLRKIGKRSKEPGYVYGRPPYGYRIKDGHLQVDPACRQAIRTAYTLVREGGPVTGVAERLSSLASGAAASGAKAEYWDPVKVRRLINHARLYCLGEYTSPSGKKARLKHLAILPASWVTTLRRRTPRPIPKRRRSGTLGSHPPATR